MWTLDNHELAFLLVFFFFLSMLLDIQLQILYSLRSRCGHRLTRGDFDRSSDALVLAVRAPPASSTPAKQDGDADGGVGGAGGAGELVAVVELTIRKPDGSLPFNWPFPAPWRREVRSMMSGNGLLGGTHISC